MHDHFLHVKEKSTLQANLAGIFGHLYLQFNEFLTCWDSDEKLCGAELLLVVPTFTHLEGKHLDACNVLSHGGLGGLRDVEDWFDS